MLGGLVAGGVGDALRESMVARTAEAVANAVLGRNLAASVSSNVLSLVRLSTVGGAGALLAKLKVPVMLVLLLAAVTASAAGSSARVRETIRDAVGQWSGQWQLAPAVRRVMQMFRSPLRVPRVSSSAGAGRSAAGNDSSGAAPVGGAGRAPTLFVSGAPRGDAARAGGVRASGSAAGAVGSASPRAAGVEVVAPAGPGGAVAAYPAREVPQRRVATPAAGAPAPGAVQVEVAHALSTRRAETPAPREPHGTGRFTRDPGGAMLSVGAEPGSAGTFTLPGGPFSAVVQDIGRYGAGRLMQLGGSNSAGRLDLGAGTGGVGTYDLAGNFTLAPPPPALAGGVYVGGAGQGALNLGNANSSGSVLFPGWFDPSGSARSRGSVASVGDGTGSHGGNIPVPAPASDLVVRGDPAGSGVVRGWGGAVGNGGVFVQNGRVIADGYGQPRSLIFLGYRAVTNTIDNPDAGGDNGWFARNGGRLILPKLATARGTNTYTWGENPADPTIDLVNSVRLTLRDAEHAGKIDVSLLDKTRPDVPVLPRGHTFIGVWSIDTGLTRPDGGVDLTVRYDEGLAHHLGLNESVLKLWQYEGDRWVRINDASFSRDVARNTLSGHANPDLSYFAVSAPEPSSGAVVLVAGAALLLRRRRRTATH
jgi:hypothetical protein